MISLSVISQKMHFGFGNKVILNCYYSKKIYTLPIFPMTANGFFSNSTICFLMKTRLLRSYGLYEPMEANYIAFWDQMIWLQ